MFKLTKKRSLPPKKSLERKGYWFEDDFLSYIRGYAEIDNATRDAMRLHNEVNTIHLLITPINDNVFFIEHPDADIKKYLTNHFLGRHNIDGNIYGHAYSFSAFIQEIAYSLITDGLIFYAIDWERESIGNKTLVLPKFRYLRTATMYVKKRSGSRKYAQKYSFLSWLFHKDYDGTRLKRKFVFDSEEIFYLSYPFSRQTPTMQSLKYIPQLESFWKEMTLRSKAAAHPEDISFPVEKTRYQDSTREMRNKLLIRAKVRGIYNSPVDDLKVTSYYDVYQVVKQKKFLNNFRGYIINEFNNQIMKSLSILNKLSETPLVKEQGIMTNREIDEWHQKYIKREIDINGFISHVIKIEGKIL